MWALQCRVQLLSTETTLCMLAPQIDLLQCNVTTLPHLASRSGLSADTVVMNPPFGTRTKVRVSLRQMTQTEARFGNLKQHGMPSYCRCSVQQISQAAAVQTRGHQLRCGSSSLPVRSQFSQ